MEQLKGPWKAVPTGLSRSGLPEHEIHWSDKGECVAEIVHGKEAARRIAAAPELLEALVRLLRANESDYELIPDMDVRTAFETNSQAVKQAREAIAKATESP